MTCSVGRLVVSSIYLVLYLLSDLEEGSSRVLAYQHLAIYIHRASKDRSSFYTLLLMTNTPYVARLIRAHESLEPRTWPRALAPVPALS